MRVSFFVFAAVILYVSAIPVNHKTLTFKIQPILIKQFSYSLSTVTHAKLTGEQCLKSNECEGSRECLYVDVDKGPLELCEDREGCICLSMSSAKCEKTSDCPKGEECVTLVN